MPDEYWAEATVGTYAQVHARIGWRGLSSAEYTDKGPYLIAGRHIVDGKVQWQQCDHISERRYRESFEIALCEGDVIISKDGTIGRVARIDHLPGEATINGTMMLVRPSSRLDYRYLYHVLCDRQFQTLVKERVSGSTIPHLFQRDITSLTIRIPPLREQQRIADILDAVDNTIRTQRMVMDKVTVASSQLANDLLFHLKIEHRTLEKLGSQTRPFLKTGPFGSSLKGDDWVARGIPVVTIGSLRDGYISDPELLYVSDRKAATLPEYRLIEGDIVFSRVADVARSAVVSADQSGWLMSSNLMRIAVDAKVVLPKFVQLMIAQYLPLRQQIRMLTNSSGREVVNDTIMRQLKLPWVPVPEQRRLLDVVAAFNEVADREALVLAKHEAVREGLMEDLLTGRVRALIS